MAGGGATDKSQSVEFAVSLSELRELMELRANDAYQRIQSHYSGVLELCRRLYTSPTEGQSFYQLLQKSKRKVRLYYSAL